MLEATNCAGMLQEYIKGKVILEVGCGTGIFSQAASSFAKTIDCIDIENYAESFSGFKNITFKLMDANKLNYEDKVFDTVIFYNAIVFFEKDIKKVIKEALRVLKPNGILILATNTNYERSQMYNRFNKVLDAMKLDHSLLTKHNLYITLVGIKQVILPFSQSQITDRVPASKLVNKVNAEIKREPVIKEVKEVKREEIKTDIIKSEKIKTKKVKTEEIINEAIEETKIQKEKATAKQVVEEKVEIEKKVRKPRIKTENNG